MSRTRHFNHTLSAALRASLYSAMLLGLVLCPTTASVADTFFLLDNTEDTFVRSNTDDVSGDQVVAQLDAGSWLGLTISDTVDTLFAVGSSGQPELYRIRQSDGAITDQIGLDVPITSIGYDLAGGTLYGVAEDVLFEIDPTTGGSTFLTVLLADGTTGLVFDPVTELLYAIQVNGELYSIDPQTGNEALIGTTGLFAFNMALNPSDSELYVVDDDSDSLFIVDRFDATVQFVGGALTEARDATGLSFGTFCTMSLQANSPKRVGSKTVVGFHLEVHHDTQTTVEVPIVIELVHEDGSIVATRTLGPRRFTPGSEARLSSRIEIPDGLAPGSYDLVATVGGMSRAETASAPIQIVGLEATEPLSH